MAHPNGSSERPELPEEVPEPIHGDLDIVFGAIAATGILPEFGEVSQPRAVPLPGPKGIHAIGNARHLKRSTFLPHGQDDLPDKLMSWDKKVFRRERQDGRGMLSRRLVPQGQCEHVIAGIPGLDPERTEFVGQHFVQIRLSTGIQKQGFGNPILGKV